MSATDTAASLWAPRLAGLIYALAIGYLLFVWLGLFQFFGVADPLRLALGENPWPRNPWNWVMANVFFEKTVTDALGLQRGWWLRLANNDFRLPLQLIAAFLSLTLADWIWRQTLGRFFH